MWEKFYELSRETDYSITIIALQSTCIEEELKNWNYWYGTEVSMTKNFIALIRPVFEDQLKVSDAFFTDSVPGLST